MRFFDIMNFIEVFVAERPTSGNYPQIQEPTIRQGSSNQFISAGSSKQVHKQVQNGSQLLQSIQIKKSILTVVIPLNFP